MTDFFEILNQNPTVQAFGFSLLHSLWQGALIAFGLWLCNQVLTARSAQQRYGLACISLLLLVLTFGYTFYQEYRYLEALRKVEVRSDPFALDPLTTLSTKPEQETHLFTQLPLAYQQAMQWFSHYSHYVFLFWLTGFLVYAIRLSLGLMYTEKLVRQGKPLPHLWVRKLEKSQEKIGYRRKIRLLYANRVSTPFTFGWLKPVIMFPLSLLTQLPADQIETILLHELAHIKRRDYLINLLQAIAEIGFFFNPGFWYISSVLEKERENACDDLVIAATHDRITYARALTNLAGFCRLATISPAALAIAQQEQSLMQRIQRIVYYSQTNPMMKKSFKTRLYQLAMVGMAFMFFAFITVDIKGNKKVSAEERVKQEEVLRQPMEKDQPQGRSKLQVVEGVITDAKTGQTIPGANVLIKGTATGTVTDLNGRYKLTGVTPGSRLLVDFINYQVVETLVSNQQQIDLQLQEIPLPKEQKDTVIRQNKATIQSLENKDKPLMVDSKPVKNLKELSPKTIVDIVEIRENPDAQKEPTLLEKKIDLDKINVKQNLEYKLQGKSSETEKKDLDLQDKIIQRKEVPVEEMKHGLIEVRKNGVGEVDKDGNIKLTGEDIHLNLSEKGKAQQQPSVYVVDNKIVTQKELKELDPSSIKSVEILKEKVGVERFGEKGKKGALLIATKMAKDAIKIDPVYILNGQEITKQQIEHLDASTIESVSVYKGQDAIDKYGEKGVNGVMEIVSKNYHEKTASPEPEPLFVLDGEIVNKNDINENDIQSMTVLKGWEAAAKYGEKGKNGVVLITSKEKQLNSTPPTNNSDSQNLSVFPNPSADVFQIQVNLTEKTPVKIIIMNTNGEQMEELVDKNLGKGVHQYQWDASGKKAGVYSIVMIKGKEKVDRKILVK